MAPFPPERHLAKKHPQSMYAQTAMQNIYSGKADVGHVKNGIQSKSLGLKRSLVLVPLTFQREYDQS